MTSEPEYQWTKQANITALLNKKAEIEVVIMVIKDTFLDEKRNIYEAHIETFEDDFEITESKSFHTEKEAKTTICHWLDDHFYKWPAFTYTKTT